MSCKHAGWEGIQHERTHLLISESGAPTEHHVSGRSIKALHRNRRSQVGELHLLLRERTGHDRREVEQGPHQSRMVGYGSLHVIQTSVASLVHVAQHGSGLWVQTRISWVHKRQSRHHFHLLSINSEEHSLPNSNLSPRLVNGSVAVQGMCLVQNQGAASMEGSLLAWPVWTTSGVSSPRGLVRGRSVRLANARGKLGQYFKVLNCDSQSLLTRGWLWALVTPRRRAVTRPAGVHAANPVIVNRELPGRKLHRRDGGGEQLLGRGRMSELQTGFGPCATSSGFTFAG